MTVEQIKQYLVVRKGVDATIIDGMSNLDLFKTYLTSNGIFIKNPETIIAVIAALGLAKEQKHE